MVGARWSLPAIEGQLAVSSAPQWAAAECASWLRPPILSGVQAAGRLHPLLAVKYRPPYRCGRTLNGTLRSSDLELPVCVVLLPVDPRPRTPARDPMKTVSGPGSAP
jgi:hypothetical protein